MATPARVTVPPGGQAVQKQPGPLAVPPRYRRPSLGPQASEALEAARAPLGQALPLRPSWWAGVGNRKVAQGDGRRAYPDLEALAEDLRADLATPRPKTRGRALAGSWFGERGADPDDGGPEARGEVPRTLRTAAVWSLAVGDVDHRPDRPAPTVAELAELVERAGLAAVVFPSPSGVGPVSRARGGRVLLPLVGGELDGGSLSPDAEAGQRALPLLLRAVLGEGLDAGPLNPAGLSYVHPGEAPRGPGDVLVVAGRALDLEALGRWALCAGHVRPRRGRAAESSGYDGAELHQLAERAGYVLGPPSPRGLVPTRCPRAHEHASGGEGGCDLHVAAGWWVCQHTHSAAEGPRAQRQGTATLIRWALEAHPGAGRGLFLEPVRDAAAEVLEVLGDGPGAAVDVSAAGAAVLDVVHGARAHRPRLVRASVGSGKTRGLAAAVARHAPPPRSEEGEYPDGALPKPSALVLVHTRERIADTVRELLAEGPVRPGELVVEGVPKGPGERRAPSEGNGRRLLPVVSTPVPEVRDPTTGEPVCRKLREVLAVVASGASARAVVCNDNGALGEPGRNPCEYREGCRAAVPFEAWGLRPDGTVGPVPTEPVDPGTIVVQVATHAGAPAVEGLRAEAPVVADEVCAAPATPLTLTPETVHAGSLAAAWLPSAASSEQWVGVGAVLRALQLDPSRWVAFEASGDGCAEGRRAWAEGVARAMGGDPAVQGLREFCAGNGPWTLRRRAPNGPGGAVVAWRGLGPPGGEAGGRALRALRAWFTFNVPVRLGGAGHPRVVAPSPMATTLRAAADGGRVVLGFDATGDVPWWRAIVGPAGEVSRVDVAESAEVSRTVVATARGGAASLQAYEGGAAVGARWSGDGTALAELVRAAWGELSREAPEGGEGAGVSRQIVARTLRAWWCLPRAGGPGAAALEACRDREDLSGVVLAALRELVDAPELASAREALEAWRARWPSWVWTWWGSTAARGFDGFKGARALVALGDPWPHPDAVADRASVTREGEADAMRALAAEETAQWWGRARAVRRGGDRVAFVHVGRAVDPSWPRAGTRVVSVRKALAPDAPAPTAAAPQLAAVVPEVQGALPSALRAVLAEGLTLEALAAALEARGLRTSPRQLRRWRDGQEARDPRVVSAVEALVVELAGDGGTETLVRRRLAGILRHRRIRDVWNGPENAGSLARRTVALREMLRRAGVAVPPRAPLDLEAFARGATDPGWIVGALLAPCDRAAVRSVLDVLEARRPSLPSERCPPLHRALHGAAHATPATPPPPDAAPAPAKAPAPPATVRPAAVRPLRAPARVAALRVLAPHGVPVEPLVDLDGTG